MTVHSCEACGGATAVPIRPCVCGGEGPLTPVCTGYHGTMVDPLRLHHVSSWEARGTMTLSSVQAYFLNVIRVLMRTKPYPPTVREVARAARRSVRATRDVMQTLHRKKYIRLDPVTARGVYLLQRGGSDGDRGDDARVDHV